MTSDFRFSERSEKNLIGVHPDLVRVARLALMHSPIDFAVIEGVRTLKKQAQLVEAGASQTMNSRHITGHAIDVMAYVGGKGRWDWPLYERIAASFNLAAADLNIPIVWGGSWRTLRDGPHYELDRRKYPAGDA